MEGGKQDTEGRVGSDPGIGERAQLLESLPEMDQRLQVCESMLLERLAYLADDTNAILRSFNGERTLGDVLKENAGLDDLRTISSLYKDGLLVLRDLHGGTPSKDPGVDTAKRLQAVMPAGLSPALQFEPEAQSEPEAQAEPAAQTERAEQAEPIEEEDTAKRNLAKIKLEKSAPHRLPGAVVEEQVVLAKGRDERAEQSNPPAELELPEEEDTDVDTAKSAKSLPPEARSSVPPAAPPETETDIESETESESDVEKPAAVDAESVPLAPPPTRAPLAGYVATALVTATVVFAVMNLSGPGPVPQTAVNAQRPAPEVAPVSPQEHNSGAETDSENGEDRAPQAATGQDSETVAETVAETALPETAVPENVVPKTELPPVDTKIASDVDYEQLLKAARGARRDKTKEAIYRAAMATHPDRPEAWIDLAFLLLDNNRNRESASIAKRATELDPTSSKAWITLGSALDVTGNKSSARDAYKTCAALKKRDEFVRECRRVLR